MEQYIGTKLVQAEHMSRGDYNLYRGWTIPADENPEDEGYLLCYPDGYESWSPKEVFEKAYLPMHVNPNLKTDKPSISQMMVDDFIAEAYVDTLGEKTTVVRAVLKNGFEIVESSSCVSKENYDVGLGTKICMEKIKDKVWMLLGFLLQTAVNGVQREPAAVCGESCDCGNCDCDAEQKTGLDFGRAIRAVKAGKKIARAGWNGKEQYVELAADIDYTDIKGSRVYANHEDVGSKALAFVGTRGVQMGWLASQSDMLAEDWMIVG